jgi:hypothetical protein
VLQVALAAPVYSQLHYFALAAPVYSQLHYFALAAPVYSQLHYFAQLCAAELLAPWMHPAILQKQLKLITDFDYCSAVGAVP